MRRLIRWPVLCTRCGSTSHFAEDCTRMPLCMGMSQQERDLMDQVRGECKVVMLAALCVVLALMLIGFLERVPT